MFVSEQSLEPGRITVDGRGWTVVYVATSLIMGVRLMTLGAGGNFFFDEWQFVVDRSSFGATAMFEPHNGHLSAVPVVVYQFLSRIVGLDDYWAFRFVVVLVHLVTATLVAYLVRRRCGEIAGLSALLIVGLMGAGWQNMFWGIQVGFVGSIGLFLVAVLLLDSPMTMKSIRRRWLVSLALLCALASSGIGVAALAAVAVHCIASHKRAHLWWIPLAPGLIYGLWYLEYGRSTLEDGAYTSVLAYSGHAASAAAGGVFGWGENIGQMILGTVILSVVLLIRTKRFSSVSVLTATFYVFFLCFVALSRTSFAEPSSSRYQYVGIISLVLIVGASFKRPDRPWAFAPLVVAVLAVWGSNGLLEDGAGSLRLEGQISRANLAAVEFFGSSLDPALQVDPVHAPQLQVGGYLNVVMSIGSSPAATLSEIPSFGVEARMSADLVINNAIAPTAMSMPGEDCEVIDASVTDVTVGAGSTILISGNEPTTFTVRRFSPDESRASGRALENAIVGFSFPEDDLSEPYHIVFESGVDVVDCEV